MSDAELRRQQSYTLLVGGAMFAAVVGLATAEVRKGRKKTRKKRARLNRCPIDVATSMGTTGGVTMGCGGRRAA